MTKALSTFAAFLLSFAIASANSAFSDELQPKPSPRVAVVGPTIESSTSDSMTKTGLKLDLVKVGSLTIPAGALPLGTKVTLAAKSDPYGASNFNFIALDSDVSRRMRHYITINTGPALVSGNVELQIPLTPEFVAALGATERTLVFAIFDDGDTKIFEPCKTTLSNDGKSVAIRLDSARFIETKDGSQRSTIVVAAVPRDNDAPSSKLRQRN